MAKLASTEIVFKANNGQSWRFFFPTYVDSNGIFSIRVLNDHAHGVDIIEYMNTSKPDLPEGISWGTIKRFDQSKGYHFTGKVLANIERAIAEVLKEYASCEQTEDYVICYTLSKTTAYWWNNVSSSPFPNAVRQEADDGQWEGLSNSERQYHSLSSFNVGIGAQVKLRKTFKRGDDITYTYESVNARTSDIDDEIQALNSWSINIEVGKYQNQNVKIIPYTKEAAIYFHSWIKTLCILNHRMEVFFNDADKVNEALVMGTVPPLLLLPPEKLLD